MSRWTVARRVEEYDLKDIKGFDHLPDEEFDKNNKLLHIKSRNTHWVKLCWKSLENPWMKIQRGRIREIITRVDPQDTALR